ncbi:MAG TPA: hypothetical protein VGH73_02305 [Thermoanaerobaculia bacterium]|jgi:hypothetical protein
MAIPARATVDPFYQTLLRDGRQAFDRKEYAAATRTLRLACFGMLDDPQPLAECLSRLALAQDGAADLAGFRQTFQRLTEIEDRFKAYSQAELPPELRSALEARLAARIPAATLAAAPAFRTTQQARKAPAASAGAVAEKTPPKPQPAQTPQTPQKTGAAAGAPAAAPSPGSVSVRPATSGDAKGKAVPSPPPATPGPATVPAAGPAATKPAPSAPLTGAERKQLDQARQLLGDRRTAKELRQAFELARAVADAHPDSKEAQLLAAESAYRISRWSDAATYFRRGGDPGDDEPERLFYMAVAFYESGDTTGAATVLKRSLPNLKRTSYVDAYARKILGQ